MLVRMTGILTVAFYSAMLIGCADDSQTTSPVATGDGEHDHDHDHGHEHHHPESFADALGQLVTLRDTVRDAFAKDDSETAHGPLHDVGHLLEELQELSEKSDLSDDAKKAIKENVDKLMDAFGAVDERMHDSEGKAGKEYSEVSADIDAAIDAIRTAAGELAEEGDHHDHDGHDHDGHDHDEHADHKDGDHHEADHKDGAPEEEEAADKAKE